MSFSYAADASTVANNSDQVIIANYFSIDNSTGATDDESSSFAKSGYQVGGSEYIADSETSY